MKTESGFIPSVELQKARVWLRPDNIVETDIYEEVELSTDDVKEIIDAIGNVSEQRPLPQLIVAGKRSGPDLEAMKHIASDGSSPYAIAEAYVIASLSQKIIAKFYINFNKPARPTKMFSNEADAVKWLQEQARLFIAKAGKKKKQS
jgi:hypothetical protein